MTGQELATAVQEEAAIVVLVVNNGMYGTIRMHQERQYPGRESGTRLVNPDFAAYARAFGAHGEVVERTADFAEAFERALACGAARAARAACRPRGDHAPGDAHRDPRGGPEAALSASPARLRQARISLAAGFFVYGAVVGTWAARIPAIKADAGLGEGELGTALLGMAAGTLAGARLGAWPVERFGSSRTTRAATAILCASLVGPALAGDLAGLVVALVAFGVAGGILDVAINANAVAVERAYRRPLLSGLHGFWSLGGLAGAAAGGLAAGLGASPLLHFGVAALVLGAAGTAVLGGLVDGTAGHVSRASPSTGAGGRTLWSAAVLLLGLVGFSSYAAEGAAADWSAVYLREDLLASPGLAAAGFAAFRSPWPGVVSSPTAWSYGSARCESFAPEPSSQPVGWRSVSSCRSRRPAWPRSRCSVSGSLPWCRSRSAPRATPVSARQARSSRVW